jgi:predicted nucleotidyltransferase component of viral defense system
MTDAMVDLSEWVTNAPQGNPRFRQAIHIILHAIASDPRLREALCLKGGILMALRYGSERFTTDLDFSTPSVYDDAIRQATLSRLDAALSAASMALGYDVACRIQNHKIDPSADATFVNLKIKVGYAEIGTRQHRKLMEGKPVSEIIALDYSFLESIPELQTVHISDDLTVCVYGMTTLVAEKYRALLQQPIRNRKRRQDPYDIAFLLDRQPELATPEFRKAVLDALFIKCRDRDITPTPASIQDPRVIAMAAAEYSQLAAELPEGGLPPFDSVYKRISTYYQALPWN